MTIELFDSTFRKARALAAARGITLRQLFTEALEAELRRPAPERPAAAAAEPRWMAGFGALADLSDENRSVLAAVEEEFGRRPPEDPR